MSTLSRRRCRGAAGRKAVSAGPPATGEFRSDGLLLRPRSHCLHLPRTIPRVTISPFLCSLLYPTQQYTRNPHLIMSPTHNLRWGIVATGKTTHSPPPPHMHACSPHLARAAAFTPGRTRPMSHRSCLIADRLYPSRLTQGGSRPSSRSTSSLTPPRARCRTSRTPSSPPPRDQPTRQSSGSRTLGLRLRSTTRRVRSRRTGTTPQSTRTR